jgi:hypothetical protein
MPPRRPHPLLPIALLAACAGKDPAAAGDSGAPVDPGCATCALDDVHNYRWSAELWADQTEGRAGGMTLDWTGLREDIHGHVRGEDFEVEEILLLVFLDLQPEAVLAGLQADTLAQSEVSLYASCDALGRTACALDEFRVLGQDIDLPQYYQEGLGSWLFLARTSWEQGATAMRFISPAADGALDVAIDSASSTLDATVDVEAVVPIVVEPRPDLILDWSGLTRDGLGNPVDLRRVDTLALARYDLDLEQLPTVLFDLDRAAAARWTAPVAGRTSLSLAALEGTGAFTGVSAEGTWLLTLICSTCTNPAPKAAFVLTPGGR